MRPNSRCLPAKATDAGVDREPEGIAEKYLQDNKWKRGLLMGGRGQPTCVSQNGLDLAVPAH